MKQKRATLEVIAPTVEEAIAKGLTDLGLPDDAVDVEVLDQGSRGLFGLGSRQARVRLAVKSGRQMNDQDELSEGLAENLPAMEDEGEEETGDVDLEESGLWPESDIIPTDDSDIQAEDNDLSVSRETVTELLEKMNIHAGVKAHYGVMDEERGRVPILIDVRGDDLGILIGRRAEVLNALQYISSLIVSKELGRTVSLVIDVEGYRSRREGQLRQLARRMADQAMKTGRRQVLEPMPANERRIIHIELREHPGVRTESIGEDPRRKVTIIPKEE
jgi:spoIIIJ-associated protein